VKELNWLRTRYTTADFRRGRSPPGGMKHKLEDNIKIRVRYCRNVKELDWIRAEYNREFLFSRAMNLSVP
jgi:hypothetical protein